MSELTEAMSDSHLITSTGKVVSTLRRVDLSLLEHLAEIEARELHLKSGYSSLFKMCTEYFHLSEASAYRRVAASRVLRKYPSVRAQLLTGEVNMCTLATVANRLTALASEEARQELLSNIRGKSKSQVEELLAERYTGAQARRRDLIRPMRAAQSALQFKTPAPNPSTHAVPEAPTGSLRVQSPLLSPVNSREHPNVPAVDKVSFRIAFTASSAFRSKLQRAQDLLKHKHPGAGLKAILEEALDHLIKAKDPMQKRSKILSKKAKTPTNPRYIPAAVKREVLARDAGQCTFTGTDGHRCTARAGLEFEHRQPFARGGSSTDPDNIELLCRNHNAFRARQEFAKSRQYYGKGKRV